MSIRDNKITDEQIDEYGVCSAPDTLTGTAAENKAVFDEVVRKVIAPQFNAIVDTFADMEDSTTEWRGEEEKRKAAEAVRVEAETARDTAENLRQTQEDSRKTAESERSSAETARDSAEQERRTAETARAEAENARSAAETQRKANEDARASAETVRGENEQERRTQENSRILNEAARSSAESARATAESNRANAENTRIDNENERISAETARKTAESERSSAESARATAETARKTAESERSDAETARATAEKARAAAETQRKANETARNVWESYDAKKAYQIGNKVVYSGSSYLCIKAASGIVPTNTAYWRLIASRGADGTGTGDMMENIYDPQGKKTDAFQYADDAAAAAEANAKKDTTAHTNRKDNPHGVTAAQIGAEAIGTAANAVKAHDNSTGAHKTQFDGKQDKLTGKKGKFVGFTADDEVGAVDAPSGGGDADPGVGELQDTEMEVGLISNAAAGWNTYSFRQPFEDAPHVICQAVDFDGIVQVKNITAEGFDYCLRVLDTGSFYTAGGTGTSPAHSAATLVKGTTTTAEAVKIHYIAVEYGGER